ncbi:MAG: hypothetical protein VB050_04875 [Geobacteraceae bacterium]|nr:hypothetical protein [Geobacteraceae bacterium]
MKIKEETWNVVLVGKWNKYILSPEWLAQNIFQVDKVQIEFGLNVDMPPRYTANNIRLTPSDDLVIFTSLSYDDSTLELMSSYCVSLFTKLSYTPIVACGINFGFIDDTQITPYDNLFRFDDESALVSTGSIVRSKTINRKLVLNENKILNFNLTQSSEGISFDFNFHYDTKNCEDAIEAVRCIVENKNKALHLLKTVYNMSLEEE